MMKRFNTRKNLGAVVVGRLPLLLGLPVYNRRLREKGGHAEQVVRVVQDKRGKCAIAPCFKKA